MVVLSVNFTPFSDLKYVNTGHDFFTDLVLEYAKKKELYTHQKHERGKKKLAQFNSNSRTEHQTCVRFFHIEHQHCNSLIRQLYQMQLNKYNICIEIRLSKHPH